MDREFMEKAINEKLGMNAPSMNFMTDEDVSVLYGETFAASLKPTVRAKTSLPTVELLSKTATKTSRGILSKGWYRINNDVCLVKGNTRGSLEPFAEFIGSRVAFYLTDEFSVLYDLYSSNLFPEVVTHKLPWVSVCKKYDTEFTIPFSKYVDGIEGKANPDYRNWIINKAPKTMRMQIALMLLVDAIIGNQDRHLNNWDIDIGKSGLVPFIDLGASCLAWSKEALKKRVTGTSISPDLAKPFASTHMEQLKHVKAFLKGDVLRLRDPLTAIEQAISQAAAIEKENPVYIQAATNYLKNRVNRVMAASKDYVEVF